MLLEEWDEGRVKEFVVLQGEVLHGILQAGPEDEDTWIHTERDLRAIVPPATRILNRYDVTRAAAAAGDEILLATALSRYATRNYVKRRRYLAALRAQEPQPVTGTPAPEGTGPESDPQWQELQEPPALTPKGARR